MNKNPDIYNSDQCSESTRDGNSRHSNKPRLLTKAGIVFLLLIAAVTLPSLTAFSDHRQSKQAAAQKDDSGEKSLDLVPMMKNKQFREGLNHVYTEPDGTRLSARVKDGKIAGWIVTDKDGKVIPSTYSASAKKKQCILCYENAKTGKRVCRVVPCDSIIVKPINETKKA
jgi:hypothetical protein